MHIYIGVCVIFYLETPKGYYKQQITPYKKNKHSIWIFDKYW